MSDVDRILSEAQQAQAEAEAAARRAAELEARAAAARQQLAAQREARRTAWAQQVIDAYDADLATADQALQQAVARFEEAAEDPAAAAARNVDLARALAALGPEGCAGRELARLVFLEDRPVADVAARLGIPEGTVKSRVYALRRRLQAALRGGE